MNIIRSDTLEKEVLSHAIRPPHSCPLYQQTRALKRLKKRWVELDDDKLSFYELGLVLANSN